MTKLQIRFGLEAPLGENQLAGVSDAHKIYGILRVIPVESPTGVAVEYDASRVSAKEVEAALRRAGIAVRSGA
jgi:hypothetical protein